MNQDICIELIHQQHSLVHDEKQIFDETMRTITINVIVLHTTVNKSEIAQYVIYKKIEELLTTPHSICH